MSHYRLFVRFGRFEDPHQPARAEHRDPVAEGQNFAEV
jgi:hypothetical protein